MAFRGAFASELREYVAGHIHKVFARAFPMMDALDRTRKLEVVQGALLGALHATPPRDDPQRLAHLQRTRDLVALYVSAACVSNKQMDAVRAKRNKKP
jgi:hypothetical protein